MAVELLRWCLSGQARAARGYGDGGAAGARRLRLRELRTAKEEREMKLRALGVGAGAGVNKACFGLAWPRWAERRRRAATLRTTRRPRPEPVGHCAERFSLFSERGFEPDSEFTRRIIC